jgi:hypothetical protein
VLLLSGEAALLSGVGKAVARPERLKKNREGGTMRVAIIYIILYREKGLVVK